MAPRQSYRTSYSSVGEIPDASVARCATCQQRADLRSRSPCRPWPDLGSALDWPILREWSACGDHTRFSSPGARRVPRRSTSARILLETTTSGRFSAPATCRGCSKASQPRRAESLLVHCPFHQRETVSQTPGFPFRAGESVDGGAEVSAVVVASGGGDGADGGTEIGAVVITGGEGDELGGGTVIAAVVVTGGGGNERAVARRSRRLSSRAVEVTKQAMVRRSRRLSSRALTLCAQRAISWLPAQTAQVRP